MVTYFMSCGHRSVTVVIIMTNQRKSLGNTAWCNNIRYTTLVAPEWAYPIVRLGTQWRRD